MLRKLSALCACLQFGVIVLTTSAGIMDHEEARRKKVGGKVRGWSTVSSLASSGCRTIQHGCCVGTSGTSCCHKLWTVSCRPCVSRSNKSLAELLILSMYRCWASSTERELLLRAAC